MDAANIPPRKGFRAKKTLRISDRQQWETLLRRRHHIENGQLYKECDHQEKNLQGMNARSIDSGKPSELFSSKHANNELPESEINKSATFNDKIEVIKTKFKKSHDVSLTENQLENLSQKGFQTIGHLETKTHPQKEHQSISLLKKNISSSSETDDQNKTAAYGSAPHISSYVLKEDFNRASKTNSTKDPKLLNQKNCVKSICLGKTWNVEPAFHIVDAEELKFISSDSNYRTRNLKKLKHSLVPMLEKMSTETQENLMNNVQLSELRITQNINDKFNKSVHSESQSSGVSKYHNEEKSDESKILTDDQDDIECTPIIVKEMKSPDRALRKRIHSRSEGKNKQKKIRTSRDEKSDHINLNYEKNTQTTKKISWEEIQNILHHKMDTELSSDILGKKLEELTRRIENIDCTQKHEELAKSIQSRIKRLEKKVKTILQTVNRARLQRNPEEPKMAPVPHYPTSGADLKNGELMTHANYVDSYTALVVPSDQKSQPLPYKKTPDSTNYELNLQKPIRTSNSVPKDAKIARNIPLPKNLDTVTPANTHCCDVATKTTERNMVSPDTLIWQSNRKGQLADIRQESNMTSSQMIIDLTKGDEQSK